MPITLSSGNMTLPDGKLLGTGQLIQSAFAQCGPARQTITSTVPVAVTGLSIAFTPLNPSSTIVITAYLSHSCSVVNSFSIYRDGSPTVTTAGFTNNSAANSQITQYQFDETVGTTIITTRISAYDIASTTLQRTYAVFGHASWVSTPYNLFINNRSANDMAGFSYMHIFEYETNQ